MPPRKKNTKPRTFDEHLANVVESKRSKTSLTVEEFADASGIGYQTMRRRLKGAPLTVNELERIGVVVGVSAAKLVQEALDDYGGDQDGLSKLIREHGPKMSVPVASFDDHKTRKQAEAAALTSEELDRINEERSQQVAATTDRELGTDEPPTT